MVEEGTKDATPCCLGKWIAQRCKCSFKMILQLLRSFWGVLRTRNSLSTLYDHYFATEAMSRIRLNYVVVCMSKRTVVANCSLYREVQGAPSQLCSIST